MRGFTQEATEDGGSATTVHTVIADDEPAIVECALSSPKTCCEGAVGATVVHTERENPATASVLLVENLPWRRTAGTHMATSGCPSHEGTASPHGVPPAQDPGHGVCVACGKPAEERGQSFGAKKPECEWAAPRSARGAQPYEASSAASLRRQLKMAGVLLTFTLSPRKMNRPL